MEINPRHKAFADKYLVNGMNATQAYLSVYKSSKKTTAETNGQKLLHNTAIKNYIKSEQEKSSEELKITRNELLMDLQYIKDFHKTGDFPTHALKAIEIINKMLGFNEPDKSEVEHKGLTINILKPNKKD